MKLAAILLISMAAAAGLSTAAMAAGAEGQDCVRDRSGASNCDECLRSGDRADGTEFCVKDGHGMSQEQIDAWYTEEAKHERLEAADAPTEAEWHGASYANCMREVERANAGNGWVGPPSRDDCIFFAIRLQAEIENIYEGIRG